MTGGMKENKRSPDFATIVQSQGFFLLIPYGKGKAAWCEYRDSDKKTYQFPMGKGKFSERSVCHAKLHVSIPYGKGKDRRDDYERN